MGEIADDHIGRMWDDCEEAEIDFTYSFYRPALRMRKPPVSADIFEDLSKTEDVSGLI